MKKFLKYYIGISVIGFIIIFYFFPKSKSGKEFYDQIVNLSLKEEYIGKVVKKYIDKNDHERKKVIIDQYDLNRTILFDYEGDYIFEFIQIGDSLIKRKNSLTIQIKREKLDTIIRLEFENIRIN